MSRRRRRNKQEAEVSTEALNDIMFFLMLFFLIVSTLFNPSVIKLMLPTSTSNDRMAKQPIIVSIDEKKLIMVNKEQVYIEDLKPKLLQVTEAEDVNSIVLRFDQSLTIQDLVNVLQVGNELKLKMVLATKHTN